MSGDSSVVLSVDIGPDVGGGAVSDLPERGVGVGVTLTTSTISIIVSIITGVGSSLAVGTTIGIAVGTTIGVAVGTTIGVAVGTTIGVAVGTTIGVAVGVRAEVATAEVIGSAGNSDPQPRIVRRAIIPSKLPSRIITPNHRFSGLYHWVSVRALAENYGSDERKNVLLSYLTSHYN
jgi:hypothetical protein